MNIWNQAPLFKALIPFVLGILSAVYIGFAAPIYVLFASVPFLIWLSLQILFPDKFLSYSNRWTTGVCIYLLLYCCGYALSNVRSEINDNRHFSKIENAETFIGLVDEAPVTKEKSYKTTLEITAVNENGKWRKTVGKCLTYFKKDSLGKTIKYGDEIMFTSTPTEVAPPPNPSQFNYKCFLSYRNIYHQVYLKQEGWKLIDSHKGNSIVEASLNLRAKLLGVFKENKIEGQDFAVLSATMLGDEDEVDQDTYNAFNASGALHVMAVSGLHVGIVFIVLNKLLFFLNRKRSTRIIKSIILLLLLGGFALLTGLSPRVLRAVLMISLIVLGSSIARQKNSVNNIAASAFILFSFNPFFLMEVGFQFSYLAVIGIIFLYQKINNWFYLKNRLLREMWSIASISIAAQLATFPLALFYYHQFPNYFLLSNIIIIPHSIFIIYGGIALLAFSKWTVGALFIGRIVGWCVHALNWMVLWIEHLPYAQVDRISVSVLETCLIYTVILLIIFFFFRKQQRFLLASIAVFSVLLIIKIVQTIEIRGQKQLIVFDVPKVSAINFIEGKKSVFLADSSLTNNESSMAFNVRHYWWDREIADEVLLNKESAESNMEDATLLKQSNFIQFHDKRIVVINDREFLNHAPQNKIKVDYIIISKNPKVKIAELLNAFDVQQIIFDSSNSLYRCSKWEEDCKNAGIRYFTVPRQGAFIINV